MKIVNIGCGNENKRLGFKYKAYKIINVDVDKTTNPDIVASVYKLPFKNNELDVIICTSVLEYLENPQKAIDECFRVLKKGGKIEGFVPFIYPYHGKKGHYIDTYRYTKDGLNYLFKSFKEIKIKKSSGYFETLGLFITNQKIIISVFKILDYVFNFKTEITKGYFLEAKK